jgi:hypothetical protein
MWRKFWDRLGTKLDLESEGIAKRLRFRIRDHEAVDAAG